LSQKEEKDENNLIEKELIDSIINKSIFEEIPQDQLLKIQELIKNLILTNLELYNIFQIHKSNFEEGLKDLVNLESELVQLQDLFQKIIKTPVKDIKPLILQLEEIFKKTDFKNYIKTIKNSFKPFQKYLFKEIENLNQLIKQLDNNLKI